MDNKSEQIQQFDINRKNPHQGQNVKWFRKKKGFSQEALALDVGVTQQTISEWEKLEILPEGAIEKICRSLDIGKSWIKETLADLDDIRFSQDGNGNNNFQQSESVTFTIHNPLEKLEAAYNNTIQIISNTYNDVKGVYVTELSKMEETYKLLYANLTEENQNLKSEIQVYRNENKELRLEQASIMFKLKDRFFNDKK